MFERDGLLRTVMNLEPLPEHVVRLAILVNKCDEAENVSSIVSSNKTLASHLLYWANSQGPENDIHCVKDAVARVGTGMTLALALGCEVRRYLRSLSFSGRYLVGDLWRHLVATVLAAQVAREACGVKTPPVVLSAAILHDLGKAVLAHFLSPEKVRLLWKMTVDGGLTPIEAESELLEMNHAEVGALLAQSWTLPEAVSRTVFFHHDPEVLGEPVSDLLWVANHMAKVRVPESHKEVLLRSLGKLGLAEKQYFQIRKNFSIRFEQRFLRFTHSTVSENVSRSKNRPERLDPKTLFERHRETDKSSS